MLAPSPALNQPPDDALAPHFHDVTVVTKRDYECARVEGVPPEEFGIARNARSLRECDYCFHQVIRAEHVLISQGYDADQIKKLPTYTPLTNTETQARDTVDEHQGGQGDESQNTSNRTITVTEHYVRMDYEGNGKAMLYRVTTGGEGDVLTRDGEPDIVQEDMVPFAAMTPVIVTHRFFGRSIADLVMDIQRIKTALLRAVLDNAYLANNPRVEVADQFANENTLDDLLVSRPGGIVRTKMPGGLQWQAVPTIGNHIFPLLEYQDATREWRTGVSKAGQGLDANALQNQTATAANQLFNAAQARMKLIARIFAETGIRDLFALLHAVIRKNGSQRETVRLRNEWVNVDPREWKTREDMTINVGLGNGGQTEQLAGAQLIIGAQKEAIAVGMVSPKNLYNSAKMLCKILRHKDVDEFFTSPDSKPDPNDPSTAPIQPPPDPKMAELQAKAQLEEKALQSKASIEKLQAEADIATQDRKTQAELALAERKAQLEERLALSAHEMKMAEHRMTMTGHIVKAATTTTKTGEDGTPQSQVDHALIDRLMASMQPPQPQPKKGMRIVRDGHGRVSHTEPLT